MEADKFLNELSRVLKIRGFQTGSKEHGALPVLRENTPFCAVSPFGTVFRRACDTDFPEDYHDVQRIADVVREYVRGMDTAQPIKAEGLNDPYKILCKMNGTVLAGMETQRHGYVFTTWSCSEDVTALYNGHYHMENYTAAKEDFAVRSGLIAENHLFTNEQLKKIQDSVKYCMNENGYLTDRQYDDLGAIVEQIEQILPVFGSMGEENDKPEQEYGYSGGIKL